MTLLKNLKNSAVVLTAVGAMAAPAAHANADVWDQVAACESGGNWGINTGNGFYGGLQFTQSTWRAYGGSGSAQHASKAQQIAVAKKVLAGQGPGAWPVCSRKAGLTKASGGASSGSVSTSRSTVRTPVKVKAKTVKSTTKKMVTVKSASTPLVYTAPKVSKRVNKSVKTVASYSSVARIQKALGVTADGVVGLITTKAIQRYVGVNADGVIGVKTVRAMEAKAGVPQSGAHKASSALLNSFANAIS